MNGRAVEVIGHAGAAGFFPHNSADSLNKAIELGVDRIEVDILTAAGDVLILAHDASMLIDGAKRHTHALELTELRSVLDGMLTLEEAIEMTADRIPLLLDIKGRHYAGPLIRAIGSTPHGRNMSACGVHGRTLRELGRAYPEMSIGLSRGHSLNKVKPRFLQRVVGSVLSVAQIPTLIGVAKWCGAREVMIQHHICTRALVWAAHLAGLRVNAWTVDLPSEMRRVLRSGADGIISNRPDLVFDEMMAGDYRRITENPGC